LFGAEIGFYKRKDQPIQFQTYETVKPYRIGVVRGYSYPPDFVQAALTIEEVTTDEQNLKKLQEGRIQLAVIDKGVAIDLIKTKLPELAETVEWIDPPIEQIRCIWRFRKKAQDAQKKFEDFVRGYQILVDNGTIQKAQRTIWV